nr:transposase zinc-binding domain-containing protein [Klebsiella pneumoniae]
MCEHCRAERLVAFSCKKRGFCPSCGARRMAESARHLVEEVFGPRRQWVLSFPYPCVSCSPASQKPLARCWASCSA